MTTVHFMILLGILIICSAFFSATETAFTSLSMVQIQHLAGKKGRRGKLIKNILSRPDILLTTILLGNNLCNLSASAITAELTNTVFRNIPLAIATGILTFVILIFAEITPKNIAILHNSFICWHTARLVWFITIIFRPFTLILGFISRIITRIIGTNKQNNLTLEGLLHMVKFAENVGLIGSAENQMIRNVFRISEITVKNIVTYRTQVFSLDCKKKLGEVMDLIIEKEYSRIPIYQEHPENIIGVVLASDIFRCLASNKTHIKLEELMIVPLFIPESKHLDDLLMQFRKENIHIAIVLDEYGGFLGIVTLEDIIEEIVGELYDEKEERSKDKIQQIESHVWQISGDAPLYMVQENLGLSLEHSINVTTVSGFVEETLGRFAHPNDFIDIPQGRFTVINTARHRITLLKFIRDPKTLLEE